MTNKPTGLWSLNFIYSCAANFMMNFAFYLIMPVLPFFIVENFSAEKAVVGLVLSSYVIATLITRPVSGFLLDSYSRKKIYILSFIFFASLFFGYLVSLSILILVIVRILHGLTWGIIATAGSTIAIDIIPSERRWEGIGYYGLTANLAMALGPLAGTYLHNHYTFTHIFYVSIISSFLGFAIALLIKAPVKIKKVHQALSLDRFILKRSIPVGINFALLALPYGTMLAFAVMYGKEINVEDTGMFFTFLALGVGGSRIFSGKLIDRGKIHFTTMMGIIILSMSYFLFSFSSSEFLYFTSAFLIGVGYGTIFPAFLYLFINMAHHNQRGTANSTYLTSFDLGIGLGMIMAGKISEISSLSTAFGFSALINTLAVIYYWRISKISYEKKKIVQDKQ